MQFLIQKATSDDHGWTRMGPLPGMMLMQGLPPGYMHGYGNDAPRQNTTILPLPSGGTFY